MDGGDGGDNKPLAQTSKLQVAKTTGITKNTLHPGDSLVQKSKLQIARTTGRLRNIARQSTSGLPRIRKVESTGIADENLTDAEFLANAGKVWELQTSDEADQVEKQTSSLTRGMTTFNSLDDEEFELDDKEVEERRPKVDSYSIFRDEVVGLLQALPDISAHHCQQALNEALTFLGRAGSFLLSPQAVGEYELVVVISEARNLVSRDRNGLSDPYCKVKVPFSDGTGHFLSEQTSTMMKTLNPIWNCQWTRKVHTQDTYFTIDIEVFDWDMMSSDDPLGTCTLRVPVPNTEQAGVAADTWLLLEGDDINTGEIRVRVAIRHSAPQAKHWDPEGCIRAKALERHKFDKFGAPIEESLRRDWWQISSYLECREMRQLAAWGESARLESPLQQSVEFLKLMGIDELVWMGIPWSRRGHLYKAGLQTALKMAQAPENYYQLLCSEGAELHREYSLDAMEIQKDVARTGHGMSYAATDQGKEALTRILRAYAARNKVLGYCQSLSYIGEILMKVMEQEEDVFWCLTAICEDLAPGHYPPSMMGYKAELQVLEFMLQKACPNYMQLLRKADPPLSIEVFTSSWILCMFTTTFPTETTLRILDVAFFWGTNIVLGVAAAFLRIHEKALVACGDAYESLNLIKSLAGKTMDPDLIITKARQILKQLGDSKLDSIREDYWREHEERSTKLQISRTMERVAYIEVLSEDDARVLVEAFHDRAALPKPQWPVDYLAIKPSDIIEVLKLVAKEDNQINEPLAQQLCDSLLCKTNFENEVKASPEGSRSQSPTYDNKSSVIYINDFVTFISFYFSLQSSISSLELFTVWFRIFDEDQNDHLNKAESTKALLILSQLGILERNRIREHFTDLYKNKDNEKLTLEEFSNFLEDQKECLERLFSLESLFATNRDRGVVIESEL
eukprot:m.14125 g.14125  ORF g.14125 m.14125 type:complete len:908 (+) comp4992_c0_seq1:207-2930(+)